MNGHTKGVCRAGADVCLIDRPATHIALLQQLDSYYQS
jgi:hypothetical protein